MKSLSLSSLLVASVSIIALACSVAPAALPAPCTVIPVALEPVVSTPVAVAVAVAAPAADCIDVDDEHGSTKRMALEGVLRIDTQFAHPARGRTRPFILQLQAPRCAVGTPEPRVVEVQLASTEGIDLKPLVGKHIRVTGEPFAAHTAWHARDVVFMTTSATVL